MTTPTSRRPLPLIRDAVPADRPAIVEFNRLLAVETEHKVLDPAILDQGVARALAEPDRLRYWVAELPFGDGPGSSARPPLPASGATGATAGSGGCKASTSRPTSVVRASSRLFTGTFTTRPWHHPTSSACGSTSRTATSAPSRLTRPWE